MRLIVTKDGEAKYNMALDEALFIYKSKNLKIPPTLRIYGWKPPAFSIGYFQKVEEVLDLRKCEEFGISWVRRLSGGGAILHQKEVTYSFITNAEDEFLNISTSYAKINKAILRALKLFNLNPEITCRKVNDSKHHLCFLKLSSGDILLNGRKISGSAQRRRKGVVLHHGSIRLDTDINLLENIFKVDKEEVLSKMTSLKRELGEDPGFDKVAGALSKGFEEVFEEEIKEGILLKEEINLTNELVKFKYAHNKWNFKK